MERHNPQSWAKLLTFSDLGVSSEVTRPGNLVLRLGSMAPSSASQYTSEFMDLVALLKRPEGKTLEFKRDLSSLKAP